jgi:hypothetical protein
MAEADPQTVLSSMQNSMWGGGYFDLRFTSLTYGGRRSHARSSGGGRTDGIVQSLTAIISA